MHDLVVPKLSRLAAGFPQWSLGFALRALHVEFVDKVELDMFFFESFGFLLFVS
jgi:hypothetical protein